MIGVLLGSARHQPVRGSLSWTRSAGREPLLIITKMARVFYTSGRSSSETPPPPIDDNDSEGVTDIEEERTHLLRRPGTAVARPRVPARELRDATGRKPLQKACQRRQSNRVLEILRDLPDIEDRDYAGTAALHTAALQGDEDIVRALLDNGAVVDVRSGIEELDTPLMDAVANGFANIVKMLLDAGADPRILNATGRSPLDFVDDEQEEAQEIRKLLTDRARALRIAGAEIISSPNHPGASPSLFPPGFTASKRARAPVVLDIGKRHARADLVEQASRGNLEYVGVALERGWRPTAEALVQAARYGHSEVVGLLLAFGLSPNEKFMNTSALVEAVLKYHYETARLLISSGAKAGAAYRKLHEAVIELPESDELRTSVLSLLEKESQGPSTIEVNDRTEDSEHERIRGGPGDDDGSIDVERVRERKLAKIKPGKRTVYREEREVDEHSEGRKISDSRRPPSLWAIKPSKKPKREETESSTETNRDFSDGPRAAPPRIPANATTVDDVTADITDKRLSETLAEAALAGNTPAASASTETAATGDIYSSAPASSVGTPAVLPVGGPKRIASAPALTSAPPASILSSDGSQVTSARSPEDDAAWQARSRELEELARRREQQRRDREAKMLSALEQQSRSTVVFSDKESSSSSRASSAGPGPSPLPDTTCPPRPIAHLPYALRKLAATRGARQDVSPLYANRIGDQLYYVDLQLGLLLGLPRLHQQYPKLQKLPVTDMQKQLLWRFCRSWLAAPFAEQDADRAAFMRLNVFWVLADDADALFDTRPAPVLISFEPPKPSTRDHPMMSVW